LLPLFETQCKLLRLAAAQPQTGLSKNEDRKTPLPLNYIKLNTAPVNKFNNFNNICNILHICMEKNATQSVGLGLKAIILIIILHLI
jgi:hypothetical protein